MYIRCLYCSLVIMLCLFWCGVFGNGKGRQKGVRPCPTLRQGSYSKLFPTLVHPSKKRERASQLGNEQPLGWSRSRLYRYQAIHHTICQSLLGLASGPTLCFACNSFPSPVAPTSLSFPKPTKTLSQAPKPPVVPRPCVCVGNRLPTPKQRTPDPQRHVYVEKRNRLVCSYRSSSIRAGMLA